MKISTILGTLVLATTGSANPQWTNVGSNTGTKGWTSGNVGPPNTNIAATPKGDPIKLSPVKDIVYGDFRYPKVPKLPPPKWTPIKDPKNDGSTCGDVERNPWFSNGPTHRGHWLPGFNINTDYTRVWPPNGKTVRHTFTVTNVTLAPDGVPKQMLVVNGQYPGPTITANWGDWIEVTVINGLKHNGTGMHWHGFRQFRTNLMDGAGGATECPIAPGESRTYRFQATSYGSTWYHSHFSVQYGDGVAGPMVINGPSSANYDVDLGPVMITDYYANTAPQADWSAHRQGPPEAKNYLINGQNAAVDGSTGKRTKFTFTPGKKHLLRLINHSMDNSFKFSVDGHRLLVVEADFVPIVPYYTNEVALQIGQRYHVIVEANQKAGNYFARAMASLDCSPNANPGTGTANAIVSYANAPNPGLLPNSTATNHTNTCVDEPIESLTPIVAQSVDSSSFARAARIEEVDLNVSPAPTKRSPQGGPPGGGGGPGGPPGGGPPGGGPGGPPGNILFFWTLGGVSQVLDWKNPVVMQSAKGNNTYDDVKHVIQLNQSDVWTYWVIQNKFFVPHPMHLHGHDFNLLGQGNGVFNPATDMGLLNFKNPPRRDVAMLVAQGWTVIAFKTDNPGAWLLHCHIAWHAGEGLSLNFLERPKDVPALYGKQVQGEVSNSCKKWASYEKTSVWPQYDSGLKRRADGAIDWAASRFIQAKERRYWGMRRNNVLRRRI